MIASAADWHSRSLREDGELLIVADTAGKQHQIRKSDILTRQKSALSLMPGNFSDVLKPERLNHLVAWLMPPRGERQFSATKDFTGLT
jgi:hypothetical protein